MTIPWNTKANHRNTNTPITPVELYGLTSNLPWRRSTKWALVQLDDWSWDKKDAYAIKLGRMSIVMNINSWYPFFFLLVGWSKGVQYQIKLKGRYQSFFGEFRHVHFVEPRLKYWRSFQVTHARFILFKECVTYSHIVHNLGINIGLVHLQPDKSSSKLFVFAWF